MAYKQEFYSGFKYSMSRESGFFRMLGITSEYSFAPVYESYNIIHMLSFYGAVLDFYGSSLHCSLDSFIRSDIEKLKCIYHIQTSESVRRMSPDKVPDKLKAFGLYWHWWREKYGSDECGIISEITAVNILGNCLQVFDEDCLHILLMYYSMFHDDFVSGGLSFPNLKALIDDLTHIISMKGVLYNKHLFRSTCHTGSDYPQITIH